MNAVLRVINVVYLGRVDYSTALDLQQTLVHLVKEGRVGHTLLLLEHPPVITLGRNASNANIIASPDFLHSKGVELFETDRGGDVTFHGPGQLVEGDHAAVLGHGHPPAVERGRWRRPRVGRGPL